MPTIIDSLFLELGIDVSKFSRDQQNALAKISQFEDKAKKSGKGASDAIQSVGSAFRDLAKDSRIGASAAGIDSIAKKFTALGKSAQFAGAEGLGGMALGIGALLSPVTLGIAAVSLLGKEVFDFNRIMTSANATIDRQAQLSGMNAKNLWSWGEAAKTVGANPTDVTGNIAGLQTAIMGMGIGAGDATGQVVGLSRLGVPWNFQKGVDIQKFVEIVHRKAKAQNYQNLGALRALTMQAGMGDALWNISTDPAYDPAQLQKQIAASAPANLNQILQKSLKSQAAIGRVDIDADILKETAYGGTQGLISASVDLLRGILGGLTKLVDFFVTPGTMRKAYDATVDAASRGIDKWVKLSKGFSSSSPSHFRMASAMKFFTGHGVSAMDAEAIVGNLARESSMNPLAVNASGHRGYAQWDKGRQRDFSKQFGYEIASSAVAPDQQSKDQLQFVLDELRTKQRQAWDAMAKAKDLMGKTRAFRDLYERPGPGDNLAPRLGFALDAKQLANLSNMANGYGRAAPLTNHVTSTTHIGELTVNAPSADPKAIVAAARDGITKHPLMSAGDLSLLGLSTRGVTQ